MVGEEGQALNAYKGLILVHVDTQNILTDVDLSTVMQKVITIPTDILLSSCSHRPLQQLRQFSLNPIITEHQSL